MKTPAEALAEIIHVPYVHSIDGSREFEAEAIMVMESIQRDSYRQARLDMAKIIHDAMMQRAGISKSSPQITDDEQAILSAPDKP